MKSHIFVSMLIGILGISPLCYAQQEDSNTSIEEVKKETRHLLQTIGSYSADQKDEAIQKAKESLDRVDKRIDMLEERIDTDWDNMKTAARNEARENLKILRKQRNEVAEWYGSMKTSSGDAWNHVKNGFSDAYQALENAWEESEKEFSK